MLDYYNVLEVSRNASECEIRSQYKKMALKWHPDKNVHQQELAQDKFQQISEAYEVLINSEKRVIYDQFGVEGLKQRTNSFNQQQPNPQQQQPNPHQPNPFQQNPFQQNPFQQNPFQQNPFQQNPFQQNPHQQNPHQQNPHDQSSHDQYSHDQYSYHQSSHQKYSQQQYSQQQYSQPQNPYQHSSEYSSPSSQQQQRHYHPNCHPNCNTDFSGRHSSNLNAYEVFSKVFYYSVSFGSKWGQSLTKGPLRKDLECTLEMLYTGFVRKTKFRKRLYDKKMEFKELDEKILKVSVPPGCRNGTEFVLKQQGHVFPGKSPLDIVFTIKCKRHEVFLRRGDDLYYIALFHSNEASDPNHVVRIQTLDGRQLVISLPCNIHPSLLLKVPNEGMPKTSSPVVKGNLFISFKLVP